MVPAALKGKFMAVWAVMALPGLKPDSFFYLPLLAAIPAPIPCSPPLASPPPPAQFARQVLWMSALSFTLQAHLGRMAPDSVACEGLGSGAGAFPAHHYVDSSHPLYCR